MQQDTVAALEESLNVGTKINFSKVDLCLNLDITHNIENPNVSIKIDHGVEEDDPTMAIVKAKGEDGNAWFALQEEDARVLSEFYKELGDELREYNE